MKTDRLVPETMRGQLAAVLQSGFWVASLMVLWSTLADTDGMTQGLWDKALHFTAFYGLAVIGAVAFPLLELRWIGLGLLLFGLSIEALQKLPFIHRDASWADFLADGAGVAFALGPFALERLRRQLQ
jgi:hypothetical protein